MDLEQQAGQVKIEDGFATLEFTRFLKHSPEEVWQALVSPENLAVGITQRLKLSHAKAAFLQCTLAHLIGQVRY